MEPLAAAVTAAAVSLVSAVTQVVPIEAYLVGLGALGGDAAVWLVSAAAGLAHGLGKLVWYEVGRSARGWGWLRRWLERPAVQRSYARWVEEFEGRPRLVVLMLLGAAVVSIPPLAVAPTIAGQVRTPRLWVVLAVALGRTVRFAALLGAVDWLAGLL